jgi:hypothetical protein
MPSPVAFAKGFGINKSSKFGDWKVEKITIGHNVIAKWKHYQFPIEIKVKADGKFNEKKLYQDINDHTFDEKTIYSQYNNPYRCMIAEWKVQYIYYNGTTTIATLTALGDGVRIYDN